MSCLLLHHWAQRASGSPIYKSKHAVAVLVLERGQDNARLLQSSMWSLHNGERQFNHIHHWMMTSLLEWAEARKNGSMCPPPYTLSHLQPSPGVRFRLLTEADTPQSRGFPVTGGLLELSGAQPVQAERVETWLNLRHRAGKRSVRNLRWFWIVVIYGFISAGSGFWEWIRAHVVTPTPESVSRKRSKRRLRMSPWNKSIFQILNIFKGNSDLFGIIGGTETFKMALEQD